MIYGMEIKDSGIKEAFKENIAKFETISRSNEVIEEFEESYGEKDTKFVSLLHKSDVKLSLIKWSLMYKEISQVKEALPELIYELRRIAYELEERTK